MVLNERHKILEQMMTLVRERRTHGHHLSNVDRFLHQLSSVNVNVNIPLNAKKVGIERAIRFRAH